MSFLRRHSSDVLFHRLSFVGVPFCAKVLLFMKEVRLHQLDTSRLVKLGNMHTEARFGIQGAVVARIGQDCLGSLSPPGRLFPCLLIRLKQHLFSGCCVC